jgi:hypothetical protein
LMNWCTAGLKLIFIHSIQKFKQLARRLLYVLLLVAAVTAAGCGGPQQGRLPPLRETFSKADQNPFGAYIAYRQLEAMYYRNTIRDKRVSFDKTWNNITDTAALYVCITPSLYLNEDEANAMMNYVAAGNTLFIAANKIDADLLNELDCKQSANTFYLGLDSLRITHTATTDSSFAYYYLPFKSAFTFNDTVFTKTLGVNDDGRPNFILYYHGKGRLILHTDPKAFSNYFLLKKENYKFMEQAFSFTPDYPDRIYWDDYYRKQNQRRPRQSENNKDFSTFSEIMKHPPLKTAFWLSLLGLVLYIAFGLKRRQRIIEKIKPNENTTVTFTETIGRLYLQKKDNRNIAEKMITYFNEHVRNNYFVNTNNINSDFITTLSRKSGVEHDKVEALYRAIQHVNNNATVDDYQLLSLNQQIQQFYKK